MPAIEAVVPRAGRVLELGCGHGVFSAYLARSAVERHVVGVDIDGAKIEHARRAAAQLGVADRLTFDTVPQGWAPTGEWDAVVVVDVLYLLDENDQEHLLRAIAAMLRPKATLVVKEMATVPQWKARWNRVQEHVSTRVLGITAGQGALHFLPPERMSAWLRSCGLDVSGRRLDRGYPWPHHLLVASCPGEPSSRRAGADGPAGRG